MSERKSTGGILPPDLAASMFAQAPGVHFDAGQAIYALGDRADGMMLIDEGRIEISVTSIGGRKSVLNYMGAGELLGEIAALDGGTRSADAVAATAVAGRTLSRRDAMGWITARPEAAQVVIAALCAKVRSASDMFATQATVTGRARLARGLLRLFDLWGTPGPEGSTLPHDFSQQEIGAFVGLARENVNRHMRTWSADGVLQHDGKRLVLRRRAALEAACED